MAFARARTVHDWGMFYLWYSVLLFVFITGTSIRSADGGLTFVRMLLVLARATLSSVPRKDTTYLMFFLCDLAALPAGAHGHNWQAGLREIIDIWTDSN